jgi:hypothetical protein
MVARIADRRILSPLYAVMKLPSVQSNCRTAVSAFVVSATAEDDECEGNDSEYDEDDPEHGRRLPGTTR